MCVVVSGGLVRGGLTGTCEGCTYADIYFVLLVRVHCYCWCVCLLPDGGLVVVVSWLIQSKAVGVRRSCFGLLIGATCPFQVGIVLCEVN